MAGTAASASADAKCEDLLVVAVRLDKSRTILGTSSILMQDAAVPAGNLDMNSVLGYLRSYKPFEQALTKILGEVAEGISQNYITDDSQKKTNEDPWEEIHFHQFLTEHGTLELTTVGKGMESELGSEGVLMSLDQQKDSLICITNAGASYRQTAKTLNHLQHRSGKNLISSEQLLRFTEKTGAEITEKLKGNANSILENAGIDPKKLLPYKGGNLSNYISFPEEEDVRYNLSDLETIVDEYNTNKEPDFQIKLANLKDWIEKDPKKTIYVKIDEIGVRRQKEHRTIHGKVGSKSAKNVENTVVYIQKGDDVFAITASSMFEACRLTLAFLLENGMKEGVPLVFFSDGARNIKAIVEKYFAFYPCILFLDWYHVQKKISEFISSAFKGKKAEKGQIYDAITSKLWIGDVDGAYTYIESIVEQVRNDKAYKELKKYLERKKPYLYCYALRKQLHYTNSSSRVEKANDQIVARRQKHKGMSWSVPGSGALAVITATRLNDGLDAWIEDRQIPLNYPA